jgi:hypothetical protein
MDDARLRAYLDGWTKVCNSTPESVEAMISGAHPEIRFTDVNSPNVHIGHEGIRKICGIATGKYPGTSVTYRDLLFDGRNWSIRWTMAGPRPDGTVFSARGASAGSVGEDGRVVEHTDYWNRAGIQAGG